MPVDSVSLAALKAFLNKLFQFESQDLDFGIYRILNIKSKEIKAFIDSLLTNKVKEQLQVFDATQSANLQATLQEQEADETVKSFNRH